MENTWQSLLRGHAFAIAFCSYALGIICAATAPPVVAIAAPSALALAGLFLTSRVSQKFLIAFIVTFMAGESAATLALWHRANEPYAVLAGHHVVADAVAIERPRFADNASFRARIVGVQSPSTKASATLAGTLVLVSMPTAPGIDIAGQKIILRGRVDLPQGPRNEGEPGERDILGDQGVGLIVVAHRATDVAPRGEAPGWEAWWARARQRIADKVEGQLPALEATVLEGILWGDRGNLPTTLRQEFSDTGTVHVLTTAGLHLGIMTGFIAWVLSLLPLTRPLRVAFTLAGAWLYAALAGLHLPTLRAATMLTAGAAALELGRGRTTSAIFAAAASAVVLPHPLVLLSPSFAMSFACVVGIALVNPILTSCGLRDGCGLPPFFVEVLRTSLAVQIALWPLQALYFNALTPYAVLANAVVVPLIGLVMAVGALFCVAALTFAPLAVPLGNIVWWGLSFIIAAVQFFAGLPAAHIDMPPPTHFFLIGYWLMLAGLAWALTHGVGRRVVIAGSICSVAVLVIAYSMPGIGAALDRKIHLDAIDVGQADCFLIRSPGGHAMLVDGGGRLERTSASTVVAAPLGDRIATRTVIPFLLRHWVFHLDAVVLTHPHGDHAGGLPVILTRERVERVYDSAQQYSGPAYHRMLDVVGQRHIQWIRAERGITLDLGPTTHVRVLAPELPFIAGTSSDINNNSVVLRVVFGRIAMLLTGDAQSEAEARLLSHGPADLYADVLKVGHHGSAYSSTPQFLDAVHPKIAIISCGLHNVFGHPSPRTLAALATEGARVFRTDQDGGVQIVSDGARIWATSMSTNSTRF